MIAWTATVTPSEGESNQIFASPTYFRGRWLCLQWSGNWSDHYRSEAFWSVRNGCVLLKDHAWWWLL